eukprot:21493_1
MSHVIDTASHCLVFGYLRDIQHTISHIIPIPISELCLKYWFFQVYILKRYLTDKEKSGTLPLSPTIHVRFVLSNYVKPVNFGRDPANNQMVLNSSRCLNHGRGSIPNDILVSRKHGRFIYNDEKDKWYIYDNRSTNGIVINQERIVPNEEHPLKVGDVIVFGKDFKDTEFKYILSTASCTIAEHHFVFDDFYGIDEYAELVQRVHKYTKSWFTNPF